MSTLSKAQDVREHGVWKVETARHLRFNVAAYHDLRFVEALRSESAAHEHYIPYCINYESFDIVYSLGLSTDLAAQAPFHYKYLRDYTTKVAITPLSRRRNESIALAKDPIFIFSPGRCASTLLASFIRHQGFVCLSEPDIFSDAVMQFRDLLPEARPLAKFALECAACDLLKCYSDQSRIVIKLRSHANLNPGHVLSVCRESPRTVFILRAFVPWAISRWRAFRFSHEFNLNHYVQSLKALKWLAANTNVLLIDYDDLVLPRVATYERLLQHMDAVGGVSPETLGTLIGKDAQDGTALERNKLVRTATTTLATEVTNIWKNKQPKRLIDGLKIRHITG